MTQELPGSARSAPVMVTGATGYVAGWLIKRLLEEGLTVHAAVRNPNDDAKRAHLDRMAAGSPGTIKFFAADLLRPGSHAEAMRDCQLVFHTASPFVADTKGVPPQQAFVEPALTGTRDVLESVNQTPSVRKVVLTSSCAAMCGGDEDLLRAPNQRIDESLWNKISTLENNPYAFSKTVAEKAAWEIAEKQDRWKLAVINPSFVLGPSTSSTPTSASFDYVRVLGDGTCANGAPPFCIGMVDVRDVAEAHLRAGFRPGAEGRHIVSAEVHTLGELAEMLRSHFGDAWPFPLDTGLPEGMLRWNADNQKSREKLGLDYRSVREAVIDMFQQMIDGNWVKRPQPLPAGA